MHFVYILKSLRTGKLYIGFTNNLKRRLQEHNRGICRSTKNSGPFELVYYEAFKTREDAQERERKLKLFKQGYRRLRERLKFSLS